MKGDLPAAASAVQEIVELSRTSGLAAFTFGAHLLEGILAWHRGQLPLARELFAQTLVGAGSLPEREGGWVEIYAHEPSISPRMFLALTCSMSGDQPGAAELLAEVLALARGAHPYVETFSLFFAARLAMLNRDPVKADQHATRGAELARGSGFPLAEGLSSAIRGWALSQQHDPDAGLAILVESISRVRATGARMLDAFLMTLLAEAQIAAGRSDEALATIRQALADLESSGAGIYEAELHRLHGELLAGRSGSATKAGVCFRRAIAVAREQGAVLFERRAEESLATLGAASAMAAEKAPGAAL